MYVIESDTHGVFVGIDWSTTGNSYGPRFRWAIPTSLGETFHTLPQAKKKLAEIKTFKHYAWKRPSWIDKIYVFSLDTAERFG